jgi:hypothetical protein
METISVQDHGSKRILRNVARVVVTTGIVAGAYTSSYAAEGITYGGPRGGSDINGAYLPDPTGSTASRCSGAQRRIATTATMEVPVR